MRAIIDTFGNTWLHTGESCSTCGQPDNCGDCTHEPLTREEVIALGGIPTYRPRCSNNIPRLLGYIR